MRICKRFYTFWAFINILDKTYCSFRKKIHVEPQTLSEGKCALRVEVVTASALCGWWWWCGLVQLPWRDSGLLLSCPPASVFSLVSSFITSLRLWYIHLAVAARIPWSPSTTQRLRPLWPFGLSLWVAWRPEVSDVVLCGYLAPLTAQHIIFPWSVFHEVNQSL